MCLVWSPEFWNLCGEKVMREIENEPDITVGVHTINLLRYADDIVLVADSPQKLQSLLDKVVADSAKVGLSLNYKKNNDVYGCNQTSYCSIAKLHLCGSYQDGQV